MNTRLWVAVVAVLGMAAGPAFGADANAGRTFFRAQCALCHSAEAGDNGGAQGPNLEGVMGRKAAATGFGYSTALKASGLTWDAPTLDRFLAAPTTVVPGSSMVIPVPQAADRENLIAYLGSARGGAVRAGGPPGGARRGGGGGFGRRGGAPVSQENADWKKDAPGVVHRVDVAKLPAPGATPSASNFPLWSRNPPT